MIGTSQEYHLASFTGVDRVHEAQEERPVFGFGPLVKGKTVALKLNLTKCARGYDVNTPSGERPAC